ncbi:MAG: hypothetical protein FWG61_00085, partial [Firmicutes bacterium]|nr:hypothetical protein [Bacillota bacterium]
MKNFRDVLRNLTIKKICVFAAIIAIIVVAVIFTMMHKAYPHVESILSQLSYGMSFEEVTQITGDLGMNSGSLFFIYHKKFPDGNDVLFLFHGVLSVENKILWRVSILSNDDLFFGQWLDYDLDRQLLLEKFMPESLDGIEYGMKIEEVEEVFCRNAPEDVTFFGASKFRSIIWEGEVITTYEKTDVTTWKKIIKLSTGV